MSKNITIPVPDVKKGWAATCRFTKSTSKKTADKCAAAKDNLVQKRANHKTENFKEMLFSDSRAMRVSAMETVIELTKGEGQRQKFMALSPSRQDDVVATYQAQLQAQTNTNNKEDN